MRRRHRSIISARIVLASVPVLLGGWCGGEVNGPTDTENGDEPLATNITFEEQVACAQECLFEFKEVLDALMHVLHEVDNPSGYTVPPDGFSRVNLDSLYFRMRIDLKDPPAGLDAYVNGIIRPPPANPGACSDGMQERDVCVFDWNVVTDDGDTVAVGGFSAVHMGWATYPYRHEVHKYLIVERVVIQASETCFMSMDGFDIMMELADDDWSSFFMDFETVYAVGSALTDLDASTSWAAEPNSTSRQADMYITAGAEDHTCQFDLDTFELASCS